MIATGLKTLDAPPERPLHRVTPNARPERQVSDIELAALGTTEGDAHSNKRVGWSEGATGSEDAYKSYLHDILGLTMLSREEELSIARRSAAGDLHARQRLIEANLRLVIATARSYATSSVPLIDLIQEGNLGLMHAAEKFDWRRGYRFGTYAGWWIRQSVSRAAAEQSRLIHLPEHVADRLHRLRRIASQLSLEYGAEPSPEQIAQAADLPVEQVQDLQYLVEQPLSLDVTIGDDGHQPLHDVLEDPEAETPADIVSQHELSAELYEGLGQLEERARLVVMLRFGIGDGRARTLTEVAQELRLSRERVRQIEVKALARLRAFVTPGGRP
jgi:RNA polymerase primary sigma factor